MSAKKIKSKITAGSKVKVETKVKANAKSKSVIPSDGSSADKAGGAQPEPSGQANTDQHSGPATENESATQKLVADQPLTRVTLKRFLRERLGFRVPDRHVCGHHDSPMDYLWHAYACDLRTSTKRPLSRRDKRRLPKPFSGDCIVWANRGGGKTQLAAVATLLEGLFKPHCRTRILAGSLDQSSRMYEYLGDCIVRGFRDSVDGRLLSTACRFTNGASVRVLAQSPRAVRGRHIHKLRCDEIELFDEDVFNAAKFITHSTDGLRAAMEIFSTLHRPYGLMQELIENAAVAGTRVFQWCLWEVIERCGPDRSCSRCPLAGDCGGKARHANGYLKIDDCIDQMRRSSRVGFESEMLCLRPNLEHAVFADFDPQVHVAPVWYDASLPLYRAIDFGYTNPFVCLWLQVDGDGVVRIIDEYSQSHQRTGEHGAAIIRKTPCAEARVAGTYCDPAGIGHHSTSGTSDVNELKDLGIRLGHRPSRILDGVELIRRHLKAGDGAHRLVVDPRCGKLIEALQCYHYPRRRTGPSPELPQKDGTYDHPIDALRYFFINYTRPSDLFRLRY